MPACFFRRFFLLLLLPFPRAPTATLAVRLELSLSPAVRLGPSLSLFSAFVAPDPILPFIFARYAAAAPRLLNARVPAAVCDLSFYRQVLWCVVRRDSRCRSRSYPPPGMRQPSPDSRTLAFRLQSVTCLFTAKGFVRRDSRWLAAKERKNFLSSAFRYGAASFRLSCCLTFLLIEGLSHALLSNRDRPIMRRVSFQCE